VYEFMLQHKERDRERWSYYDEFLKSKKIKKVRDHYPDFDTFIVQQIQTKKINRAVDIRDSLPTICVGPTKNLKRYIEGKLDFEQAYDNAVDAGGENADFKRLFKFRQWLATEDTQKDLLDAPKNIREKIVYELEKIGKRAKQLKTEVSAKSSAKT